MVQSQVGRALVRTEGSRLRAGMNAVWQMRLSRSFALPVDGNLNYFAGTKHSYRPVIPLFPNLRSSAVYRPLVRTRSAVSLCGTRGGLTIADAVNSWRPHWN